MSIFALCDTAISLGANASVQAVQFALCFAVGIAFSFVGLLYFLKCQPVEKFVVDLFATLSIGAGLVVCCEFFLNGKWELFGIVAYLLGVMIFPTIFAKISPKIRTKKPKTPQKSQQDNQNQSKK